MSFDFSPVNDFEKLREGLARLYGAEKVSYQEERYRHLLAGLQSAFGPCENGAIFSAPGRTEIGGNHTDHQHGCHVEGFNAYTTSSVLKGSGLSSSAAFEVLVGNIINSLCYEDRCDSVQLAQIGQYAENVYFGKPSGLLDQMASSVGGMVTIDFQDNANPVVEREVAALRAGDFDAFLNQVRASGLSS